MEPIEKWREEFESIHGGCFLGRDKKGIYRLTRVEYAWTGFLMAKRSQPVVELPNPFHDSVSGYECDELHESLTAAGIQYRIKGE